MSICLADFSAVKKELDSLDEQIIGQTRKLRQLQVQDEEIVKVVGNLWVQYASELSSIAQLECEIADRRAASSMYETLLEETEQVMEKEKV